MTLKEFCYAHDCTLAEREALRLYLACLRMQATLQLSINWYDPEKKGAA